MQSCSGNIHSRVASETFRNQFFLSCRGFVFPIALDSLSGSAQLLDQSGGKRLKVVG